MMGAWAPRAQEADPAFEVEALILFPLPGEVSFLETLPLPLHGLNLQHAGSLFGEKGQAMWAKLEPIAGVAVSVSATYFRYRLQVRDKQSYLIHFRNKGL